MLRRLGLELAGGGDVGHQGQVHVHGAFAPHLVAHLADGLEERQAFDVADGAADLAQQEIRVLAIRRNELLDGVGDVGDDLHRGAEIVPVPLPRDYRRIDAAGGDVVALARRHAGEAFVMAEVEVGFGAVVGDIDLAVLKRAHGPRIDVEIGIELAQTDLEAAGLQERPQGRGSQSLAKRGNDAAGDKDEPGHRLLVLIFIEG